MLTTKFHLLEEKAYKNRIAFEDALCILETELSELFDLIASANRIRERYKGNKIGICSIVNAKSGRCTEDCAFCAQSVYHNSNLKEYSLLEDSIIIDAAEAALRQNAHKFGIVSSGRGIRDEDELNSIRNSITAISKRIHCCASLGMLDRKTAFALKKAGLREYHHNLETAESFFKNICSTHSYNENIDTVKAAKEAGLRVCCGGIFGMGETLEQRVELAFTLKNLDVDSIPLNFLHPVRGTKLGSMPPIKPIEILKIIAMFRFVHPEKDIKVAGGREINLRDLQSFIFAAGANSTMVGDYLTTKGRNYKDDIQMIKDLELEI